MGFPGHVLGLVAHTSNTSSGIRCAGPYRDDLALRASKYLVHRVGHVVRGSVHGILVGLDPRTARTSLTFAAWLIRRIAVICGGLADLPSVRSWPSPAAHGAVSKPSAQSTASTQPHYS